MLDLGILEKDLILFLDIGEVLERTELQRDPMVLQLQQNINLFGH